MGARKKRKMSNTKINVNRYANPSAVDGWEGWIEPEDQTWILYFGPGNRSKHYPRRDPATGAVIETLDTAQAEAEQRAAWLSSVESGELKPPQSHRSSFEPWMVKLARVGYERQRELMPCRPWDALSDHERTAHVAAALAVFDMVTGSFPGPAQWDANEKLRADLSDEFVERKVKEASSESVRRRLGLT